MDRRIRDTAIETARKAFKRDASEGRQHSPEAKAQQSSKQQGRHVTPEASQDVYADMLAKAPTSLYGHQVSQFGYQSFSGAEKFALHPGLVKAMGVHAKSLTDLYGNVDVDFTVPFSASIQTEGLRHAHSLRNHAQRNGKNIHSLYEQFLNQNHQSVSAEVMVSTAIQLRFGTI